MRWAGLATHAGFGLLLSWVGDHATMGRRYRALGQARKDQGKLRSEDFSIEPRPAGGLGCYSLDPLPWSGRALRSFIMRSSFGNIVMREHGGWVRDRRREARIETKTPPLKERQRRDVWPCVSRRERFDGTAGHVPRKNEVGRGR